MTSTVMTAALNAPISSDCAPLNISGKINVINGPKSLYIQYVYGQELVTAYQQMFGSKVARIATCLGKKGAGHGVLLQDPRWTQAQILRAVLRR